MSMISMFVDLNTSSAVFKDENNETILTWQVKGDNSSNPKKTIVNAASPDIS